MSFDTIRLPASAIADLYRQSLVVLDDVQEMLPKNKPQQSATPLAATPVALPKQEPTAPSAPQPIIQYSGGFQKRISVVIDNPTQEKLPTAEMEMLQKLMTACKLVADDFAIINTAINQPAAQELWQLMPARVMLLFGVDYKRVGIPFIRSHFQVEHWNDAWFMSAPPLATFLGTDTPELKALKRELWNGFQKIFLGK